jgi:hypothetical protein
MRREFAPTQQLDRPKVLPTAITRRTCDRLPTGMPRYSIKAPCVHCILSSVNRGTCSFVIRRGPCHAMSPATRTLAVNGAVDEGHRQHREEHVVHIGYHKTASTWLQAHVFPHLAGLYYRDPLLARVVTNLATADSRAFFGADCRVMLRQIARRSGGRLLLSHEGLSGSLWDGYARGPRNAERIRRVLPDARIVVFVRRQQEMLRSIHAQYVNEGGTRPLFDFVDGYELGYKEA